MDMPAPKLAILGRKPAIVAALRDVLPADAVIDAYAAIVADVTADASSR